MQAGRRTQAVARSCSNQRKYQAPFVPAKAGTRAAGIPSISAFTRGNERSFGVTQPFVVLPYSVIDTTTPAPTVLPPWRIANRCFSSIALGDQLDIHRRVVPRHDRCSGGGRAPTPYRPGHAVK